MFQLTPDVHFKVSICLLILIVIDNTFIDINKDKGLMEIVDTMVDTK